ncbi:hypothetical protein E2I00_003217, partial [Balaenoptera physalus]
VQTFFTHPLQPSPVKEACLAWLTPPDPCILLGFRICLAQHQGMAYKWKGGGGHLRSGPRDWVSEFGHLETSPQPPSTGYNYLGSILRALLHLGNLRVTRCSLHARALGWGEGIEVGRGTDMSPDWRQGFLWPLWVQLFPLSSLSSAYLQQSKGRPWAPFAHQENPLLASVPGRGSWFAPFPLEEPGPRPMAPGSLPSPALSLEKEEEEEDEDGEDAEEPEELRSEEHPSQFFAEAQRLREQRLLLDEDVSVGGRVYGVHRVILAAVSSLFRGRLLGSRGLQRPLSLDAAAQWGREGAGSTREDEKQPSQAEELRENLRTMELLYQEGIGCDLELEAGGCRLRVHRAALACGSEFFGAMLLSGMRESQGTEVSLHTISAQDLQLLVSFAYSGVVRARWPGLLRAAQAALRDELHLLEEFEAFAAARRWLAANPDTQESEAKALLRCVRFGRMSTRELRRAEVPGQERRREPDQALVVIGGDGLRSDMAMRQPSRGLPALPAPGRFRHGAASLAGSELYVCGGQDFYGHSNTLASTLRWDPSQGDWEEMAPLCQARSFFPLVALDGLLYALGGRDSGAALSSVETYSPKLNMWSCCIGGPAVHERRLQRDWPVPGLVAAL